MLIFLAAIVVFCLLAPSVARTLFLGTVYVLWHAATCKLALCGYGTVLFLMAGHLLGGW